MTQTLNVEYEELLTRAAELEQPLPTVPSSNPQGPCNLSFISDTATRLALTADTLRLYLKGCEREWRSLAKSLRNAAKAYEEVDTGAAEDIGNILNNDASAAGVAAPTLAADEEPWTAPEPMAAPPPFEYPYYEVRQAAEDIETGDQGTSFRAFAQEWKAFQQSFQEQTYRFRLFSRWEGEATEQVERNFQQQKEWIYKMAKLCADLGQQADRVVDVHKKVTATTGYMNQHALGGAHPTTYEVSQCDYWYRYYVENGYQEYIASAIDWYEKLQATSESALKYYVQYANIPLKPLNPDAPPKAHVIKAPGETPKPDPKPEPKPDQGTAPSPTPTPTPAQLGQLAGNMAPALQGAAQGMQGAMQGIQGLTQGMGGASTPAQLASDTTPEPPPADEAKKDDEDKDKEDQEKKDEATTVAEGAAAGDQASGNAPTEPPAAGQPGATTPGGTPSGVVL
ncbi:hypothetical protein A9X03_12020 [Mycobacterium sp. E1715]|uniref:PPE domain-containing protein n=1 Tax=unclassified Mycobacterium TaxID=2642494 RepID=UPI000800D03E|nr:MULTISPECIES: hypothetical protein [unclassified Mycobacterium]OBG61516.1 hypothetical protein A5703_22645 [Mycobacterium sp. E188]OBG72890.1 hypothetical protein A9X05_27115 [Mycobacterium sp. E3298]OBH26825.1 hypothetical protein A9X03_12020 [Mycobacterium sp. E1715]OBH37046.1 hypothetical protein A5691_03325 [Mycobacterium sp. E183]